MTKQQQEWARVCEESQLAPAVCGPAEAAEAVRKVIEKTNGYEFEHIVALFLNNQSKIIGTAVIGIGGFAGSNATPAILFKKFFTTKGASAFIVGHNHPTGNLTVSEPDYRFTTTMHTLAQQLGVNMLDSLIVTATQYVQIPIRRDL